MLHMKIILHAGLRLMAMAVFFQSALGFVRSSSCESWKSHKYNKIKAEQSSPEHSPIPLLGLDHFDVYDLLLQRSIQTMWLELGAESDKDVARNELVSLFQHTHLVGNDVSIWHSLVGMRVHFNEFLREILIVQHNKDRSAVFLTMGCELIQVIKRVSAEMIDDLTALGEWDSKEERLQRVLKHRQYQAMEKSSRKFNFTSSIPRHSEDDDPLRFLVTKKKGSAPLRRSTAELLHRACTLSALRNFDLQLARAAVLNNGDYRFETRRNWIGNITRGWRSALSKGELLDMSKVPPNESDLLLRELSLFAPIAAISYSDGVYVPSVPISSAEELIDPPAIAETLRDLRSEAASSLAASLARVDSHIANLHREVLERAITI